MHNKFKFIAILCGLAFLFLFACKVADPGATADDTSGGTDTKKWTVTVELNGGTGLETSYTVDDGKTLGITNPTRTGYTFVGWAKSGTSTTADFDINTPITVNTNIYALWNLLPLAQRIILTKDFATFHTFQYQVEIQAIDADTTLEFIVTHDETPPAYANIQNDGAKKTAFFSVAAPKRGVYFSFKNGGTFEYNASSKVYFPVLAVTPDNPNGSNGGYINLLDKADKGEVRTAIEKVNPALLSPGGTYYLHVYKDSTHIKSTEAITLPDYFTQTWNTPITRAAYDANPTTAIDISRYIVGREGYKTTATSTPTTFIPVLASATNSTIEENDKALTFIPFSFVFPVEYPKAACSVTGTGSNPPTVRFGLYIPNTDPSLISITTMIFRIYPMYHDYGTFPSIAFAPPSAATGYGTNYTNSGTSATNTDKYFVYDLIYPFVADISLNNNTIIYNSFKCSGLNELSYTQFQVQHNYNIKVYDK